MSFRWIRTKKVEVPDVAMGIHPGLHADGVFEFWEPTLDLLMEENVLTVFTMFNKEEQEGLADGLLRARAHRHARTDTSLPSGVGVLGLQVVCIHLQLRRSTRSLRIGLNGRRTPCCLCLRASHISSLACIHLLMRGGASSLQRSATPQEERTASEEAEPK